MGSLENILICCIYLTGFMVFFIICTGIYWVLEKIGFMHWLRGWLWYFGLIDECPDTERNRQQTKPESVRIVRAGLAVDGKV